MLREKKYFEAEELLNEKLMRGVRSQTYLPLGRLCFELCHNRLLELEDYERELDLETAVLSSRAKILCRANSMDARLSSAIHKKQSFVSLADDVLVYRFESDVPISTAVSLELKLPGEVSYAGTEIYASGRCPTAYDEYDKQNVLCVERNRESIPFAVRIGFSSDGVICGEGKSMAIRGATEVTVIMSVATGFNGYDKPPMSQGRDYERLCREKLSNAMSFSFEELLRRHTEKYSGQYSRTELRLDGEKYELLPAIPREWKSGSVRGFKTRGGKKISFSWKNGKIFDLKEE